MLEFQPLVVNSVIRNNHLRGNRDGVLVEITAEHTFLERNVALSSEDDGIDVDSPATTLIGNLALHNEPGHRGGVRPD